MSDNKQKYQKVATQLTPPSEVAVQEGKLRELKEGESAEDLSFSVHAEGATGMFIGYFDKSEGRSIPAVLYVEDGKVVRISTPYDNELSKGRANAYVRYDLGVLFTKVITEGQIV